MERAEITRRTNNLPDLQSSEETYLPILIDLFLTKCKSENLKPGTLKFYRAKLAGFLTWCETQVITQITQLSVAEVRGFLLALEEQGHNPGGRHAHYRTLKAFLNWYELEYEPEGWKNPIRKVKAPKVDTELLEPVELATVDALVGICKSGGFYGSRDKAIFLLLLDTGLRAQEALSLDLADVDTQTGQLIVRKGKGGKGRPAFVGKETRRALRAYLKLRPSGGNALFVTRDGERLEYDGLRAVVNRRSKQAGVKAPTPHAFRRAYALTMLRRGVDIYSLRDLMGHSGLQVLQRYLKQQTDDLQAAHNKGGPVDKRGKQ